MSNVTTQYANDAFTTITNPNLAPIDTLITLADSSEFPIVAAPDYFYATLQNVTGAVEVVKVVTHAGTNTFTVERGQDNTTALAWVSDDYIEMRPNSAVFEELRDHNHDTDYAELNHHHDLTYINTSGDTMTGPLSVLTPSANAHAATKVYVDDTLLTRGLPDNKAILPQGDIPNNNANDLVISGFYRTTSATTNMPSGSNNIGFLSHFNDIDTDYFQVFHEASTNRIYTRVYDLGIWPTDWTLSIIDSDYATDTVGGTIKVLQDGTDLYITTNGDDAVIIP